MTAFISTQPSLNDVRQRGAHDERFRITVIDIMVA